MGLLFRWHLIIGVFITHILLLVSLSGAAFAFAPQLQQLFDHGQRYADFDTCTAHSYQSLLNTVSAAYPDKKISAIAVDGAGQSVQFSYFDQNGMHLIYVDPLRGKIIHHRRSPGGVMAPVLDLHSKLMLGKTGRYLVELSTSWLFVTIFLGLLLWWPTKSKRWGSWLPRLNLKAGHFWRDTHVVLGFWLLPLCLFFVITGLFFSQMAGKNWRITTVAVAGMPASFAAGPSIDADMASDGSIQPVDVFITQHNQASGRDSFFLLLPYQANGSIQVSNDLGQQPWHYQKSWFNPYNGELLQSVTWADFNLGGKIMALMYPLHSGRIAGWPTQLAALLTALAIALTTFSGFKLWWQRRKNGTWPLPDKPQQAIPKWWLIWLLPLLIVVPTVPLSLIAVALLSFIQSQFRRRRLRLNK